MMPHPKAAGPNGVAAGAILAAGIGSATLGLLTTVAEASQPLQQALSWYPPAGPLSGKTSVAVLVWLVAWVVLHRRWKDRSVDLPRVFIVTLSLLGLGLLGTFPPFYEMLRGSPK